MENNNKCLDLKGKRFGRLVVLEKAENIIYPNKAIVTQWKCKCDCGNLVTRRTQGLISGKTKSCGCLRNEIGNKPFAYEIDDVVSTKYSDFTIIEHFREERKSSRIKDKKYICKCNYCFEKNVILEHTLLEGIGSCKACSDVRSFGEKFFYWFLKQLEISFDTEYSPSFVEKKRYDFYFNYNNVDYIVEIDGAQHYNRSHKRLTPKEVKEIDLYKQFLAEENGFVVIRIDCQKSNGLYIRESIENSILSQIFNLENIDWLKCFFMAMSTNMRKCCELWNMGYKSTNEIENILGLKSNYVSKLLAQCSMYGLCDYNSVEEKYKGSKSLLKNSKKIICLDNGMIFQGAEECSRKSLEVFGIYLRGGCITRVCRKERKAYKGFHFEYVEE